MGRMFMRAELTRSPTTPDPRVRGVTPTDEQALGQLLFDAYLGTVDQEEETLEQARLEVRKTFAGEYGSFDPGASKVLVQDGKLGCAVLVTRFQDRPFIAFTMTTPACKGRGLARACLAAAMAELRARGEHEVRLVVTLANEPAVRLYRSLGFAGDSVDNPSNMQ